MTIRTINIALLALFFMTVACKAGRSVPVPKNPPDSGDGDTNNNDNNNWNPDEENPHGGATPERGFLTAADMTKPSAIASIPQANLATKLADSSLFYYGKGTSGDSAMSACIFRPLDNYSATATASSMTFSANVTIGQCAFTQGYAIKGGTLTVLYNFTCDVGNLTQFNGASWKDIRSLDLPCPSGKGTVISNTKFTGVIVTDQNQDIDTEVITGAMTASSSACAFTVSGASRMFDDSCVKFYRSTMNMPAGMTGEFFSASFQDVVGDHGARFYTTGQMSVVANDWSGSVTFSGPSTSPKFQMSKNGVNATGQIAP